MNRLNFCSLSLSLSFCAFFCLLCVLQLLFVLHIFQFVNLVDSFFLFAFIVPIRIMSRVYSFAKPYNIFFSTATQKMIFVCFYSQLLIFFKICKPLRTHPSLKEYKGTNKDKNSAKITIITIIFF